MEHAGKRLARWRDEHHVSQNDLAAVLGTSADTVRAMERSGETRRFDLLIKIAALTKIGVSEWRAPLDADPTERGDRPARRG